MAAIVAVPAEVHSLVQPGDKSSPKQIRGGSRRMFGKLQAIQLGRQLCSSGQDLEASSQLT